MDLVTARTEYCGNVTLALWDAGVFQGCSVKRQQFGGNTLPAPGNGKRVCLPKSLPTFFMVWFNQVRLGFLFFFFFFFGHPAQHAELPQPGIKPVAPAVEALSLNHLTTGEVPMVQFNMFFCPCISWKFAAGSRNCIRFRSGPFGQTIGCT